MILRPAPPLAQARIRALVRALGIVAASGLATTAPAAPAAPTASGMPSASRASGAELHDCLVEPMTVAAVGSPVPGVIAELFVERGESVVRGQPLAALESGVEAAEFEHAEARAHMLSEIAARDADLELAKLDLARVEELRTQDLVPTQELDEARARERVASAAVVQALENRALLKIEARRAAGLLEQRTIRSPVDGVVVEQHAFPGEFVYDKPVTTVARIDPLRIEVVLPAQLFGAIAAGERASVYPELDEGVPLEAIVDVVDAVIDTGSGTFGVRMTLPNASLEVPGGQRCRVAFEPVTETSGGRAGDSLELAEDGSD